MKPYHFYLPFNPLFNSNDKYESQAHEFFEELKKIKQKNSHESLYWGKLKISEFTSSLNVDGFSQVVRENQEIELETHLFITDYQFLWVGKVRSVTSKLPTDAKTLNFYNGKNVEVWFELSDFHLISNESESTLAFIYQLHIDNPYQDNKIDHLSPMVNELRFPLVIQDRGHHHFFKNGIHVLENNPMLNKSDETLKMESFGRSFVIPQKTFSLLPDKVRSSILHSEVLLMEALSKGKRDRVKLEKSIFGYLECLELLLNETFVSHLREKEGHNIFVSMDSGTVKILRQPQTDSHKTSLKDTKVNFTLNQIKMLIDTPRFFEHTSLDYIFRDKKSFWEYCRLEFRNALKNESILELYLKFKNKNQVELHDRELLLMRNILLGVGGVGLFSALISNWYRDEYSSKKVA